MKAKVKLLFRKVYNELLLKYRRLGREEIIVLGDSHVDVFRHKLFSFSFPNYFFNIVCVYGATASGLENPNSKTQTFLTLINHFKGSKAKTTIVQLGEVDTGFVIWYRAEKYNTSVSEMLEKALINYQKLLLTLSKTSRVICMSTPLPTIKDGQHWGEIANARKKVKATQLQRTKLTLQFNMRMQVFCKKNGISYLPFDRESIGQNGLVDSRLLNSNSTEHHYAKDIYAEMILDKLKESI